MTEQNLNLNLDELLEDTDFCSKNKKPTQRGGKRKGAGRKDVRGKTKVMRIPVAYEEAIKDLMRALDETREAENGDWKSTEGRVVFLSGEKHTTQGSAIVKVLCKNNGTRANNTIEQAIEDSLK